LESDESMKSVTVNILVEDNFEGYFGRLVRIWAAEVEGETAGSQPLSLCRATVAGSSQHASATPLRQTGL
jgi:hypothetical protein